MARPTGHSRPIRVRVGQELRIGDLATTHDQESLGFVLSMSDHAPLFIVTDPGAQLLAYLPETQPPIVADVIWFLDLTDLAARYSQPERLAEP